MPNLLITDDAAKYLVAIGLLDAAAGYKYSKIITKTADYTIVTGTDPSGSLFNNRGAVGAVVFTLPAPSLSLACVYYDFVGVVAAQNITVQTATADTLIAFNDLTADSVAISTAGGIIAGYMRAVCDGVSWIVFVMSNGTTGTVAT